ncbi:Response regulator protein TmoT [Pseudovibrio axinellae]|uniref:Response regulator protein TmoT n=1 Tax=Pseudovibrio axinellae TaxID=989403 RepID=A0A165YL42_9HYPH|nr:response regulator [Pseudovibrio axinellae]KZL18941.1 Response regulator protein TmoT [Pseudovibrio axinellae]SEP86880.1 Response regulator receiver domain-containing protein [Pseudovibrio axinellae]
MIYIVEDDVSVRDAIARMFESLDLSCAAFADGESFLADASPRLEDTVFVDLHLPGLAGSDLIEKVAALDEAPQIVAISGQPLWKITRELPKMNATPIVRKPLKEQDLLTYV